jgi:hypothetical protein
MIALWTITRSGAAGPKVRPDGNGLGLRRAGAGVSLPDGGSFPIFPEPLIWPLQHDFAGPDELIEVDSVVGAYDGAPEALPRHYWMKPFMWRRFRLGLSYQSNSWKIWQSGGYGYYVSEQPAATAKAQREFYRAIYLHRKFYARSTPLMADDYQPASIYPGDILIEVSPVELLEPIPQQPPSVEAT